MRGSPNPNSRRYENRRRMLALLEIEPATIPQLAQALGMSTGGVRKQIKALHTATPKQVYIADWERRVGGRGGDGAAPMYSAGNRRDAVLDTKKARLECSARYRAKLNGLLRAKAAVKRGTFNPFWQLTA